MNVGQFVIRSLIGPLFVGHGGQKLFGWFKGHGLEGTGGYFEQLGLKPGRHLAKAAGATELLGGALMTLGAFTPLATAGLTSTMVTAIRKAHAERGMWVTEGGYEYNLVLIGAFTALADEGPGRPSVDATVMPRLKGPLVAALSLAAGVAGSFLVTELFGTGEGPQEGESPVPGDPAMAERAPDGRFSPADAEAEAEQPGGSTPTV